METDEAGTSDRAATVAADAPGWIDVPLVTLAIVSVLVTAFAGLLQVSYGTYELSLETAWATIFDPSLLSNPAVWKAFLLGSELPALPPRSIVVWNIRMPRVAVGLLVGANLSVSGAIFQAITRNDLASPQTLGVNAGAGLAVLLTLVVYTGLTHLLPLVAALGGTVAFLLVYAIAWNGGTSPVRLILAGIIVATVFNALQTALFFVADDLGVVQTALAWTTGSLSGVDWEEFRIILPVTLVGLPLSLAGARHLNVLVLGEGTAKSLGMNVERMRFGLSGVAILTASSAIAVAGIVGFVGLIVPHLVRTIVGSDYRRVVLGSIFVGPALLAVADVGSRLGAAMFVFMVGVSGVATAGLFVLAGLALYLYDADRIDRSYRRFVAGAAAVGILAFGVTALLGGPSVGDSQVPVGIVTGLIGGPYFLYLMRRRQQIGDL
ncbi:FecCD family ABC transporter permease [Haloarcula laminariae]|uniref:FecCD family ABC transporter permease n=1 Tax=Haloarcula laminariae TaxID=2961577 RepID=UPI0021C6A144|nr:MULTISPECIES: iron ABC transporter permease [Halomicroarcula]